jgi:hypothetical protein
LELAAELGTWYVTLVIGSDIDVSAHGYSKEGDFYVFSLLMAGEPCFEVNILRLPVNLVSKFRDG